ALPRRHLHGGDGAVLRGLCLWPAAAARGVTRDPHRRTDLPAEGKSVRFWVDYKRLDRRIRTREKSKFANSSNTLWTFKVTPQNNPLLKIGKREFMAASRLIQGRYGQSSRNV